MELIYRVKKPETIKRFIKENHIPTSILERDEKHYKIFVNNQIKLTKDTVRKGDKIHFHIKDETIEDIQPQSFQLDVVYEDEQILVVNKPANQRLMISKKHPKNTLANGIVHYYKKNNIHAKLHFMNRLDTDLSGLVVLAKHKFIKFLLSGKLGQDIQYYFKTIVEGILPTKTFNICLPIGKKEDSSLREVREDGKECETKYTVEKEFRNFSMLDIQVKNKLMHQIKVHLAYFEYPIVGDRYYNNNDHDLKQVLLDAYKVNFIHPITEEPLEIKKDLPDYFNEFINL